MNAPTNAAALRPATLKTVLLASLLPSDTHIQQMRRERFDAKITKELAESIKAVGILQPPVVRPLDGGRFEIVAGERRFLAAKMAGLKEIDVSVRELSDEQVLEVQLIENLQREGLHELEEAEGYEELMKLKKIDADTLADMVGKSRSYVYARIKLLALAAEVRKDFYAGKDGLDASTALELARITHQDQQREAWQKIQEDRKYGELTTVREVRDFIRDHFMLRLKSAPFDINDEKLLPKAGSCAKCPKRTGNQPDLFGDAKNADVCTDTKCFGEKRKLGEAKILEAYKAKGVKVLVGDDARRVLPHSDLSASGGYRLADDTVWDHPKQPKVANLVNDKDLVLVKSPHSGKMIKVASGAAVTAALNDKGVKTEAQRRAEQLAKIKPAKEKPDVEEAMLKQLPEGFDDIDEYVYFRFVEALNKKFTGALGKPELLMIVGELANNIEAISEFPTEQIARVFGWKESSAFDQAGVSRLPPAEKLDTKGLARLALILVAGAANSSGDRHPMNALLKKAGLEHHSIEKRIRAELKKKADDAKAAAARTKTEKTGKALASKLQKGWPFPTGGKVTAKKKPAAKKAKGKKK